MGETKKKVITINLDIELLERLDRERDGIPRSTYVNKMLKENLKGGDN